VSFVEDGSSEIPTGHTWGATLPCITLDNAAALEVRLIAWSFCILWERGHPARRDRPRSGLEARAPIDAEEREVMGLLVPGLKSGL
jgi:hypothetical protein